MRLVDGASMAKGWPRADRGLVQWRQQQPMWENGRCGNKIEVEELLQASSQEQARPGAATAAATVILEAGEARDLLGRAGGCTAATVMTAARLLTA